MDTAPASLGERARLYRATQRRTIDVALKLFVEHGVGETSFQMVADGAGVTKAAIYHQFRSKEALVLAVAEVELVLLEEAVDTARRRGDHPEVRRWLLEQIVDLAISRRNAVGTLLNDPVLVRYLNDQPLYRRLMAELVAVLFGRDADDRSRVRAAVLASAFGAVSNHFVADVDERTLRRELIEALAPLLPDP